MKKFSKITNQKVNEEPKVEKTINEGDILKAKVMNLMDDLLTIRTYGPVDRYLRAGSIKIAGKEMLAEAILDMLTEKSTDDKTKLLESLKSQIKDWEVIDNQIEYLNSGNKPSLNSKNKFSQLLEMYSDDEELFVEVLESTVNRINNTKTLEDYSTLTTESKLSEETKSKISEIYSNRIKQIEPSK
jgi:hypothetical protein